MSLLNLSNFQERIQRAYDGNTSSQVVDMVSQDDHLIGGHEYIQQQLLFTTPSDTSAYKLIRMMYSKLAHGTDAIPLSY